MPDTIKILITGDFYPGNRIEHEIKEKKYEEIFNDFLPVIKSCAIAVTNLEAPLTNNKKSITKTGPAIRGIPETGRALRYAGFNLVTLANNHIMDFGEQGLKDTLDILKQNSIEYIGAGENIGEASKILIKKINDKKIAFLNFAENEFSTTNGNFPGANPLDLISNYKLIQEAKDNADYIFVIVHGGHELYNLPSPEMKRRYRFFIDAGASAVIGHHTHCFSGYEIYKNAPIFYSLGNFLFDNGKADHSSWNEGFAVQFLLSDNLKFKLIPYYQNNQNSGLRLLNDDQEKQFFNKVEVLNKKIADDNVLRSEFEKFILQRKNLYSSYLEPYKNRYLHFLRNRGLFPSLLSYSKKKLLLNLIRCESHREAVIELLKHENSHS